MRVAAGLCFALLSAWASAATAAPPQRAPDPAGGAPQTGQAVVNVVARREPGEIAGSTPVLQLGAAEIAGFGASNLGELLDALGLETRGADGSPPVLLLNGVRIPSATQLRDLPPEALQQVEIYSGDTAVRFGYRAEQRVVNFVLRPSYSDVAAEGGGGLATDGGGASERYRLGFDRIRPGRRLSLSASYDHADWLLESQRPIVDGFGSFRTLVPASDHAVLSGVYATTIGGVSASLDASVGETWSRSRLGPRADDPLLEEPPLARDQSTMSAHVGLALNGRLGAWDWSLIGNADHNRDQTLPDSATPTLPAGATGTRDLTLGTRNKGDADLLFFGPLAKLPAGDLTASLDVGIDGQREDDLDRVPGVATRSSVGVGHGKLEASLNVPLVGGSGWLAPIGKLSASLSYGRDWFSDFHSLDNSSVSLIWRPSPALTVAATRSSRAKAPSIDQLGDPLLVTPNVTIFDFVRGETVDVTRLDGGLPGLAPERDTSTSVSLLLRPIPKKQLLFSLSFTDTRSQGTIGSAAVTSLAFEQAFPGRFVRDAAGRLVTVDARPVNFAAGDQQQIRWGFNLVEPLGRPAGRAATEPASAEAAVGRIADGRLLLQLSFFHTWRLEDRLQLAPGGAELDFLRGDVGPGATGQPRHELELSADLSSGSLGAGLTGKWRGGARINGSAAAADELTEGPLLVLNLKLHAAGGVDGPPLLRGALFSLYVDNLLNRRPRVRDAAGATPSAYQPAYMDPLGRVVRVNLRKLF